MGQGPLPGLPAGVVLLVSAGYLALLFGIAALPAGARRDRLARSLDRLLELFPGRVLAFDQEAARRYAPMAAEARRAGPSLTQADGFIAATAAARGFGVATRNTRHFADTGVPLVDPFAGP